MATSRYCDSCIPLNTALPWIPILFFFIIGIRVLIAVVESWQQDTKASRTHYDRADNVIDTYFNFSWSSEIDNNIDNVSVLPPKYLTDYRSPCWYESLPRPVYNPGSVYNHWDFKSYTVPAFHKMAAMLTSRHVRLRCLPLVYQIGVMKCGTSDLFYSLTSHPDVVRPPAKEPNYWNMIRYGHNTSFAEYLDLFDGPAEMIRARADQHGYHSAITEYTYFNKGHTSPEEFHELVTDGIADINNCLRHRSVRSCLYDNHVIRARKSVKLVAGLYEPFLRDWMDRFPSNAFHVITLEDYKRHKSDVMGGVYHFLGLDPAKITFHSRTHHVRNKNYVTSSPAAMLNATLTLLQSFYRPWNERLCELLKAEKYRFV